MVRLFPQDDCRMRVKSDHHRRRASLPGRFHQPVNDKLMPAVNPIKGADGHPGIV